MSINNGRNRGDAGAGGDVTSVNGDVGVVVLDYADVGANKEFSAVVTPSVTAATNVTNINAAIAAASTAGGGIVKLLVGDYPIDGSINISDYNNVILEGSGYGTVIKPQLGGTWTNVSVIYGEGNIHRLAIAINNITKGDTSITTTTAANAGGVLAGDTIILVGTDANSLADAEYHVAASNGVAGTGVIALKDKIRRTMTAVTASDITGDSQHNSIKNLRIDGTAATDTATLIGLQLSNSYRTRVERVWVENFSHTNQEAIRINAGIEHSFEDVYILKCDSYAIRAAVAVGCSFNNIQINTANVNGVLGGAIHTSFTAADLSFNNIKLYNCNYDGIRITSTTSVCRRISMNGIDVSRALGSGVFLQGGGDHQLVNGTFVDCGESAVFLSSAIRSHLSYVANRVQFGARLASATGNYVSAHISNVTNDGLYVDASETNNFSTCTFSGTFGGSQVAVNGTSANNQFPTYGTFTPTVTLVGGAGNTVPVYTTNTGRYQVIGKTVFVDVYLTGDGGAEGAGTGVINIALPVTASASNPLSLFPVGYALNNATERKLWATVNSTTTINLIYLNTSDASAGLTGADQNNATRTIRVKFFYEAA
jgi:hypothetical protein